MGSEQNDRNGLKRAADPAQGYPEQFTIVGVDISAHDLKKRYEGTKRYAYACEVIDAAVQAQRTKGAPPNAFVTMLRRARAIPPLEVCDLGRDGTKDGTEANDKGKKVPAGRNFVIVMDGRQRNLATRINNAAEVADGRPARMLTCIYQTFSAKAAGLEATMLKVGANARVARSFSSRAEDAADLKRRSYADDDIAPYVEAKDAEEVALLIALDRCEDCVKEAVDAGKIGLAKVKALAALAPIEQVRRVARLLSPNRKAADEAAPPRAKARPAAYMTALATIIPERTYDRDEVRAIVLHLAGDGRAFAEHPHLAKALESAKGAQS